MKNEKVSRRAFLRASSLMAAGTAAGAVASAGCASAGPTGPAAPPESGDTSKILNYHPRMGYRRLGKTGLMISEVSLGGHWANLGGPNFWEKFANDEVPDLIATNRTEVVSRCIDHGINYLDITTGSECMAYGNALCGRRDQMYIAADDSDRCPRVESFRNVKGQMANIEGCLGYLGTDHLDIWRPQFIQGGGHPDSDIEVCVEAFEKAHAQGKVRFLGMSSHNRDFIQHLLETFPQFSMAVFTYTAKSKVHPADVASVDPDQVVEGGGELYSKTGQKSLFETVRERDVGVVTIKPFAAGAIFRTRDKLSPAEDAVRKHELARLTLAYILCNGGITAVVPGMDGVGEVDNNVRSSAERVALLDQRGIWKLCEAGERMYASLPQKYGWLREWEWV